MGLRFGRRITIAPGVRINLGLRGASMSVGPRGASMTVGKQGVYGNVGIPGSGLSYRQKLSGSNAQRGKNTAAAKQATARLEKQAEKLRLSQEARFEIDADGKVTVLDEDGRPIEGAVKTQFWKDRQDEVVDALNSLIEEIQNQFLLVLEVAEHEVSAEAPKYEPIPFLDPEPKMPALRALPERPQELKPRLFGLKHSDRVIHDFNESVSQWTAETSMIRAQNKNRQDEFLRVATAWKTKKTAHEREQAHLVKSYPELIGKHLGFMSSALEDALADYPWPRETDVSFAIEDNGAHIKLDVDMPEIEDFPSETARLSANQRSLVFKKIPKKDLEAIYSGYVLGAVYKLCELTFRTLPKAEKITLSGYTQVAGVAGRIQDRYIISTIVSRQDWLDNCARSARDVESIELFLNTQTTRVELPRMREIQPY